MNRSEKLDSDASLPTLHLSDVPVRRNASCHLVGFVSQSLALTAAQP